MGARANRWQGMHRAAKAKEKKNMACWNECMDYVVVELVALRLDAVQHCDDLAKNTGSLLVFPRARQDADALDMHGRHAVGVDVQAAVGGVQRAVPIAQRHVCPRLCDEARDERREEGDRLVEERERTAVVAFDTGQVLGLAKQRLKVRLVTSACGRFVCVCV